jgi:hypothetical protein
LAFHLHQQNIVMLISLTVAVVPGVDWEAKYLTHVSKDEAGGGWRHTASLSFIINVKNNTGEVGVRLAQR